MSAAVVPSSTMANPGCNLEAATAAPLAPTSSWAVKTNHVSRGSSSSRTLSMAAQPVLSSSALALMKPQPNSYTVLSKTILSPRETSFSASSTLSAPISTLSSSSLGTALRSSEDARCTGLMPMTPGTAAGPTVTRLPRITRRSMPPTNSNRSAPESVKPVTMPPTSSIWAQIITGFSGETAPFLKI